MNDPDTARYQLMRMRLIGRFKGGAGFPHSEQGNTSGDIPFYKVKDLAHTDSCGRLGTTDNYIDAGTARSLGAFIFPRDTTLMAKVGAALLLHRFVRASIPCCIDNNLLGFLPDVGTIAPRYLRYAITTIKFHDVVNPGAVPSLGAEAVGNKKVPLPPLPTQKRIADFLDRKTAAIDALIDRKERLLELLAEKRAALINQAVTKGLDPNVPMKDSGIPWIGEIPAHWDCWSVRDLIRAGHLSIQDGNHGELHPVAADYVDEGIPFVLARDLQNGRVNLDSCKRIPVSLAESLRIDPAQLGDILLTHKGTIGVVASLDELGAAPYFVLTPQVTYYRLHTRILLPRFLQRWLESQVLQAQMRLLASSGVTRACLTITGQRDLAVVVPPFADQESIAGALERWSGIERPLRTTVDRLKEYRQALITAAVTGQIDVTKEDD